ncbi:MAG: ATP-binding protein [Chloroflexota bacterium]
MPSSSDPTGDEARKPANEKQEPVTLSALSNPRAANRALPVEEVCQHCGGAGWLRMNAPVGDSRFGKLYPCVCRTNATEQRNLEDLYRLSNLDAFQEKVFATFDPEVPGTPEAYYAAADFATSPEGWLLLLGGYGTGKTHLAASIANYVVQDHQMQVYFAVAPDLLHSLRSAYAPGSEITYDDRFEQIRSVYLLIIDDLGAEQSTPWAVEKLYQIFNYRYNLRLPTVVTSNCDLDRLDPRICSRLCDPDLCRHVFMSAGDFRMRRVDPRVTPNSGGPSPLRDAGPGNRGAPRKANFGNKGTGTR